MFVVNIILMFVFWSLAIMLLATGNTGAAMIFGLIWLGSMWYVIKRASRYSHR